MNRIRRQRPRFGGHWLAALVLAGLFGLLALSSALAGTAPKPEAWFDAPLPGASLPLAPYEVVVHAAADSGVDGVQFQVDGVPAGTEPVTTEGDLVVVTWVWTPDSLGEHLLTAVVEGIDGSLSDPVSVGVLIGQETRGPTEPSPSPSASPSPTSSATPVPTPGPTPCAPTAPNPVAPADHFLVIDSVRGANPPIFEWSIAATCTVTGFHAVVQDADGATIEEGFLLSTDRRWLPDRPLPAAPGCVVYFWSVWTQVGGVDRLQSAVRELAVCP